VGILGLAILSAVDRILQLDRALGRLTMALACLALALAALAGLYQVIARFVLQEPSAWTEVLTRMMVVWSVFLGLGSALRGGALLSVDLTYRKLSGTRALKPLQVAISMACLVFLGVAFWWGVQLVQRLRFQNLAGLEISISWAYLAVPVGALLGMVAVIAHYLDPRRGQLDVLEFQQ
jgi:TRAP-type C4-dicarboxylate transport system permease small subunit